MRKILKPKYFFEKKFWEEIFRRYIFSYFHTTLIWGILESWGLKRQENSVLCYTLKIFNCPCVGSNLTKVVHVLNQNTFS